MVAVEFAEMTIRDYDEVSALWRNTVGVGLDDADTRETMAEYLVRNPGLSFVARDGGAIVGAVLCGHDGRRGYLHHLAVADSRRRRGIGSALVERCISGLRAIGIRKCNIIVFAGNSEGQRFWQAAGWIERSDLTFMQKPTGADD